MASLLRNIARKNFVNFLEVPDARGLASFRQTFIKGDNVLRVLSHLWHGHLSILISVNRIVNKEETFVIPCSQSWG